MQTNIDRGNWMQTYTGIQFYPLDPRPEEVVPDDIAHALSMICRYGGHSHMFYSVAEHCVLMSHAVPEEYALWALLHDSAEAYVGDMVRPLKRMIPEYGRIEDKVLSVILKRFGIEDGPELPPVVKDADNRIIVTERERLFPVVVGVWQENSLVPLSVRIHGWDQETAKRLYLHRLRELTSPVLETSV
jgi:hypothetical protein